MLNGLVRHMSMRSDTPGGGHGSRGKCPTEPNNLRTPRGRAHARRQAPFLIELQRLIRRAQDCSVGRRITSRFLSMLIRRNLLLLLFKAIVDLDHLRHLVHLRPSIAGKFASETPVSGSNNTKQGLVKFLLTLNYFEHIMSLIMREGANVVGISRSFLPSGGYTWLPRNSSPRRRRVNF